METRFITFTDIFFPFTSYYGGVTDWDDIECSMFESILDEATARGRVPADFVYILSDHDFLKDLRKSIAVQFRSDFEKQFAKCFAKYGYKITAVQWYQPRAYNFSHDSLDFKFCFTGNHEENKKTLGKELQFYIDKIRQKSCDGYMSFEPSAIEEIEADDHMVFYAIAEHEGVRKDIREFMECFLMEDIREEVENAYCEQIYKELELLEWFQELQEELKNEGNTIPMFTV